MRQILLEKTTGLKLLAVCQQAAFSIHGLHPSEMEGLMEFYQGENKLQLNSMTDYMRARLLEVGAENTIEKYRNQDNYSLSLFFYLIFPGILNTQALDDLKKISSKLHEATEAVYLEGQKIREAADELEVKESAVKMRLDRSREYLKAKLKGY